LAVGTEASRTPASWQFSSMQARPPPNSQISRQSIWPSEFAIAKAPCRPAASLQFLQELAASRRLRRSSRRQADSQLIKNSGSCSLTRRPVSFRNISMRLPGLLTALMSPFETVVERSAMNLMFCQQWSDLSLRAIDEVLV
jgi:hypothetical protein